MAEEMTQNSQKLLSYPDSNANGEFVNEGHIENIEVSYYDNNYWKFDQIEEFSFEKLVLNKEELSNCIQEKGEAEHQEEVENIEEEIIWHVNVMKK
jgi:hypothetical protein